MSIDPNTYENMNDNGPDKNLSYLTNMMKRHVDKGQEKMLLQQREKAMSSIASFGKKAAAAEQPEPKAKAKQPNPKGEPKNRAATPARNGIRLQIHTLRRQYCPCPMQSSVPKDEEG